MKITKSRLKEIADDVLREESEYQKFFKRLIEKVVNLSHKCLMMKRRSFFNKIQTIKVWKGRGKKNEELNSSEIGKGSKITEVNHLKMVI